MRPAQLGVRLCCMLNQRLEISVRNAQSCRRRRARADFPRFLAPGLRRHSSLRCISNARFCAATRRWWRRAIAAERNLLVITASVTRSPATRRAAGPGAAAATR